MSLSKKSDLEGDFAAVIFLSEAQPPVYTYIPIHVLMHTGKGGSVEPVRRGEGQQGRVQITKLGWKYQHDKMYARNLLSPVYKLW